MPDNPDLDSIIKLMNDCFLDESNFNQFVIGSFLAAKNQIQSVDRLDNKILQLVIFAQTNKEIPKLLRKIQEKYPGIYQEYAQKSAIFDTSDTIKETTTQISEQRAPESVSKPDENDSSELGICDILVLAANSRTKNRKKLDLNEEIKIIRKERNNLKVKVIPEVVIEDLSEYLTEYDPVILHFSGHGNSKGEIILQDREGQEKLLPIEQLANILLNHGRVECVVLNACFSGDKADYLIQSVDCVIGMSKEIDDRSALRFAEGFYRGLGRGDSYEKAVELGRSQINLLQLPDSDIPHLIPREASVLELKPTRNRSDDSKRIQETFPSYQLWFGTNRKLINANDISQGFSGERDNQLHYGTCEVIVPESHEIGSIGSPLWKQWLNFKFTDNRLKLQSETLKTLQETQFWSNVQAALQKYDSNEPYTLIFIHGYNVSFEAAALRAAQLGCDLKIPPGMMAFYSWPSKAKLEGYTADEATIQASEKYLSQFLMNWVQKTEIGKVHIIAHSMGNRGLLRVMQRIFDRVQTESQVSFGQIFLAAPDVDPDLFRDLAEAYQNLAERTTLYISSKDKALQSSGIVHNYPRLGFFSSPEEITVVEGIDTVEVSNIDLSWLGHGYYGDARDLLKDIYDLLIDNKDPDDRFALQSATVRSQKYWIIGK